MNEKLGPTGDYPDGKKLHDSDEGGLQLAVCIYHGNIILDFGEPTTWIGFSIEEAEKLAETLLEKVKILRDSLGD